MGWELRYGGAYYYRSVRTPDGRVAKLYLGNGSASQAMAELDAEARARRRAGSEAVASEVARLAPPDESITALGGACDLVFEATLVGAGYHRQNYSAWRRRRVHHGRVG